MTAARFVASAPVRIDFGGGWTDVPPYPAERGGFVCNVAVARYARATVRPRTPGDPLAPAPLVAAALRHAGLALPPYLTVELTSDFPIGAGLGGSSAAGVALAAALARLRDPASPLPPPATLAEASRAAEVGELGIAGGRQDHYAAAYGGALALDFGHEVGVRPLPLGADAAADLADRLVVVYTGASRLSGDTIRAVLDAYETREPRVVDALDAMAALAREMADALAGGDLDALGRLVDRHWGWQRALHPAITTPTIDAVLARGRAAGALGGKALGASGGGCVVLIAPAGGAAAVRDAVADVAELLPVRLAPHGVRLHDDAPP